MGSGYSSYEYGDRSGYYDRSCGRRYGRRSYYNNRYCNFNFK